MTIGAQEVSSYNIITFCALWLFTTIGLLEQQVPCMDTYFDSQSDNLDNSEDYWEGSIYSVGLLH